MSIWYRVEAYNIAFRNVQIKCVLRRVQAACSDKARGDEINGIISLSRFDLRLESSRSKTLDSNKKASKKAVPIIS